ncbi:hypothetical protein OV079_02680 [Nannocystis pusilla]|uniref:Uncharacterized protein n=1 Tax=Nannocystis pusilla TaxID=889268 RepID=A0A9X3EI60_9BACT|nr:hypothetical protein [Nannocystis pusilla]MCY1004492.1 hypothetical protein [Nannocystis pusilla]
MSSKSRHIARFMPYACDREGVKFRSVRAAVDGQARGELASGSLLTAGMEWRELTLAVHLELNPQILERVVHPDEMPRPPVALVLALRCREAFLSRSHRITLADPTAGLYECILAARREELRGEVAVTPYLVRTSSGTRRPGYAWRRGAWLATGEPWTVLIDEPKPRVGDNLEVLRKRFSEAQEVPPADRANWFFLQLDSGAPRLLLNEEQPEVMRALHDTSAKGRRAAVRDALYERLDAAIWPALLLYAARAWLDGEGDVSSWQENVLRLWAKRLGAPRGELEAEVQQLAERATETPASFVLEINAALQRDDQSRTARLLAEALS